MNLFLSRNKYTLLLTFVFVISEIIVNPLGEFPLNDDWSYSKTVLILLKEGDIYIGTWCAMTLASHVVWGFLFTKVFGFSFIVLRFSTLLSSAIGLHVLNQLVIKISNSAKLAFAVCVVMLFNPLFFNLSNTFMTDVNFNTWMLLGFYFVYQFFEHQKPIYFVMVFFMSMVLVLNRQFGLMLPLSFLTSCLFLKEKKWLMFGMAALGSLLVYLGLKWYESYLMHSIPIWSSYRYSGGLNLLNKDLWVKVWYFITQRTGPIALNLLVYLSPVCLLLYNRVLKNLPLKIILPVSILGIFLCGYLFHSVGFLIGNVFTNASLGPDTFADSGTRHTYSDSMEKYFVIAKYVLSAISVVALMLYLILFLREKKKIQVSSSHPFKTFVIISGLAYLALLLLSESFFDRYNLPLLTCSLLLMAYLFDVELIRLKHFLPVMLVFVYVSVLGTKDYFTMNKKRWEAVAYLRYDKQVPVSHINAGFEMCCWNDGIYSWFADYNNTEGSPYLIHYDKLDHFSLMKEYEFQRYFPYKKDKINIFVRDSLK